MKIPIIRQPRKLEIKVPQGKLAEKYFVKTQDIKYLQILPIPPPIPTKITDLTIVLDFCDKFNLSKVAILIVKPNIALMDVLLTLFFHFSTWTQGFHSVFLNNGMPNYCIL